MVVSEEGGGEAPSQSRRDNILGKGVVGFVTTASGAGLGDNEEFDFLEGDVMKSTIDGCIEDFDKVLSHGPYIIYDQYLMVQPWTKEFSPLQPFSNVVLAWIRLPRLPGHMYKRKILGEIGSMVGRFTKLDFNTDSRTRGRVTKMVVYVNLDKPLVSQAEGNETVADSVVINVEKAKTLGMFGPWIQVKRKPRQSLRDSRNQKPKNLGKVTPGSRFLTLTTLDEIEEGNGAE
ncbi:hypothetical protein CXB51_024437 [Gossypium anomalum]|uniref:DUF4283 domain-containing protein n=1 Tax=Gossypium anomalum TaxID=47600 RepID=A0A8J6CUG8_9ROSI|nr:hypothetical protein CXB51_024437 [Gossypium anomalum]